MVGTASTGAHVDRNGDVPGPSRLGRSSRHSRRRLTYGNCIRSGTGTHRRADREVHRIAGGQVASDTFLWTAVAATGVSATLQVTGKQSASVFVGQWAPTLLILGLYNKLVKQHGSDFTDTRA
jgi:hypothetical protein